jgi:ribosomal protein L37AE/L43A
MNTLNACPCCSELLLRHARHGSIYWFCSHCRQEMPNLSSAIAYAQEQSKQTDSLKKIFELL